MQRFNNAACYQSQLIKPNAEEDLMKATTFRLSVGFLLPILLISSVYGFINIFFGGIRQGIAIWFLVFTVSIVLAGIPAILYSLSMEFVINKRVESLRNAVLISGLLGTLVVALLFEAVPYILLEGGDTTFFYRNDPYTPVLGFFIGSFVGYVLKRHYEKYRS